MRGTINIEALSLIWNDAEYNPEVFPGRVHKMKNPKVTLIIFNSGKITSVGAKEYDDAIESIKKTAQEIKLLDDSDTNIDGKHIEIENIVFTFDYDTNINLDLLSRVIPDATICEI